VAFVQLSVAAVLGYWLHRDLAERNFPLHRAIM
jgi:hypothetical protein